GRKTERRAGADARRPQRNDRERLRGRESLLRQLFPGRQTARRELLRRAGSHAVAHDGLQERRRGAGHRLRPQSDRKFHSGGRAWNLETLTVAKAVRRKCVTSQKFPTSARGETD